MSTWAVGSNQHKKVPAAPSPPQVTPHPTVVPTGDPMGSPVTTGRESRLAARAQLGRALTILRATSDEQTALAALYAIDDADEALGAAMARYPAGGAAGVADADGGQAAEDGEDPAFERAADHLRGAVAHLKGRPGLSGPEKAAALRSARARIGRARSVLAPLVGG